MLAAGKAIRPAILKLPQPEQGEPALGAFECIVVRKTCKATGHLQIAADRGQGKKVELLENKTQFLALEIAVGGKISGRHVNLSAGGIEITGDDS